MASLLRHTDDKESTSAWQHQCLSRRCELVGCRHLIGDAGMLHIYSSMACMDTSEPCTACTLYISRVQQQRNLHMGTTTMHVVSMCKLHVVAAPAPTCADGCWCPVPLTFSNLRWWCFPFQQLAQTLTLHLWWLPSATCAGGLFPSTTCAYSNLHCVVVVVVVVVLYMWLW